MSKQIPRVRGFELVTGYDSSTQIPTRSTRHSAGYDFYSPEDVVIEPRQSVFLKTGIKAYMLPDEALKIYIRSSLGKRDLELKNKVALIDADFYNNSQNEGNITLMLRNTGEAPISIARGDKVAQGIFVKYLLADGDGFDSHGVERNGGIGSTGA